MLADSIIKFFDSSFFVATVTLIVGFSAFGIYKKKNRDTKRDAASVILLEIESAEQQLQLINQTQTAGSLAENIFLMKNSSWDKYRYYFVRDFRRNEWDKITDFYNSCSQYDDAVSFNKNYFGTNVNHVQSQIMRVMADYANEYIEEVTKAKTQDEKDDLKKEYDAKKSRFINSYGVIENGEGFVGPYFYGPQKPALAAQKILSTIETSLSLTSVGLKLRSMSANKSIWKRFVERLIRNND
jgi:hypothetical protein